MQENNHKLLNAAVLVAALGYFVDIFDLILFGFVRVKSLNELGITGQANTDVGIALQNWQMFGMLIGGVIAGILGDKLGRVKVLYASIAIYSIANLLNGFVHDIPTYSLLRFLAGVGLAGELGVGVTLVAESLPKEKRGYGTTIVAAIGLFGALMAGFLDRFFDWRTCYIIGGALGFLLLILRIRVSESHIFQHITDQENLRKNEKNQHKMQKRGDFVSLFTNTDRFKRFFRCLLIGTPTWYVVGILVLLSPEFGRSKGIQNIHPGTAIMAAYAGLILGDICAGLLSQYLRSRLKVMWIYLSLSALSVAYYLTASFSSANAMYFSHFLLGCGAGFWVIFITLGAEQFGTNLRATVASSVPNFARGLLVPIALCFQWLKSDAGLGNLISAAWVLGIACSLLAFVGLWGMEETFDKDLDYVE